MKRSMNAILARCEPVGDCVIWMGARNGGRSPWEQRHGTICVDGVRRAAQSVVWEMVNGCDVPAGYEVCHTCDHGACVWPEHLWLGTHEQNMLDCRLKARWQLGRSGEAHPNARFTEAQIRAILVDPRYQRVIAADYGTSQSVISGIKTRQSWKDVTV